MPFDPATSGVPMITPGTSAAAVCAVRPVGTASRTSRLRTCDLAAVWMSTTGDEPETVTVSSSAPTVISALTVAVKFDGSSRPSRLKV